MSSIDTSKIKLFQLRAFVAVANCNSFSGAAAALDLTQSSISHAIASIVSMVAQGLGIAILPRLAALPIPETVRVCCLPKPLTRILGAVILEDALHSPAVFAFLDAIKARNKGGAQEVREELY